MSRSIRLTLPDWLGEQIDGLRGGEDIQDWILATLRQAVRGQQGNREEVERLHQTIQAFAQRPVAQPAQPADLLDTLLGQPPQAVAPHVEPQAQPNEVPRKLGW